ncbi:RNA polymerase sigma factor SigJ [Gordonia hankookensis]|uniref:RNA polymerase sigma factor SigJ n=1 Tax=Gordonia hankookensis TaxID=589403 RepID=A0ABR7W6Z3_9ACTN|nr:RNA polymerase sigma factor SigJ [Gordonia hankookensis]MBD1318595.1 RNA polymerase sigma factor SigJ [Gordonia hankookensis]
MTDADDVFTELRPLLFTVAYNLVGTATDAEDVVHDCYLRWRDRSPTDVDDPRAYLVAAVSRTGLNHLRTVGRRRETYVGNWLPEPIRTDDDASHDAVLADSVSIAMLVVLETLAPVERAVFVLHEVFDYPHAEIATMIGKSEQAVRQIAHRARGHVRSRRSNVGNETATPRSRDGRDVVARFLYAAHTGDLEVLVSMLAPDVVQMSDGGGRVAAARQPIIGADKVAAFAIGLARTSMADAHVTLTTVNAAPGAIFTIAGTVDSVASFDVADGRITAFYAIRNPEKLGAVDEIRRLDRGRDMTWRP